MAARRPSKEKITPLVRGQTIFGWWMIFGLCLVPVATVVGRVESSELSKAVVLCLTVGVAVCIWCIRALRQRRVSVQFHWVDVLVVAWYIGMVLVTLLSDVPFVSVWGMNNVYASGLLAATGGVILYFLLSQVSDKLHVRISVALVVTGCVGSIGLWLTAYGWPASFLSSLASQAGVYLALLFPLLMAYRLMTTRRIYHYLSCTGVCVYIVTLLLIDQTVVWWVWLVGIGVWVVLRAISGQAIYPCALIWYFLCLILGVVGVYLDFSVFQHDVFLSIGSHWSFVWDSPLLTGVGPNNLISAAAQAFPEAQTFFTLPANTVFGMLTETGLLVTALWGSMVVVLAIAGVHMYMKKTDLFLAVMLTVFLTTSVSFFLLPAHIPIVLLWWVNAGFLAHAIRPAARTFDISTRPWTQGVVVILLICSIVTMTALGIRGSQHMAAQYQYVLAQQEFADTGAETQPEARLRAAVRLVPDQPEYALALAELILVQQQELTQVQATELIQLIQAGLRNAPYHTFWQDTLKAVQDQSTEGS